MTNKYEALCEWLKTSNLIDSWLYFNAVEYQKDNTSVNSAEGEKATKRYIDGSYEAIMRCVISLVKPYDTEQSTINLEAFNAAQDLMKWVDDTLTAPDFGADCAVLGVEVISEAPQVLVNIDESLAKYEFILEVTYLQS